MQLTRRILSVAVAAACAASLAGCGRHSSSEHFYLVATNTKLAYWQAASAGLDKIAAQYDVHAELRGPDTFDPQAQVQEFRSVVALKPTGILVSVVDPKLMAPEINAAMDAGIPVITVDSDAPTSRRLYFIGTNNREAGRLGAKALIEKLHDKGNVVFFTMPGQPNLDERLSGYEDVLATTPEIHVADIIDIRGVSTVAFDKTQALLPQTGKDRIDAFVCLEASAGKEVGEVLRRGKNGDRVLIAMDVDKDTLDLVKQGVIAATVAQKPFTMAYVGVQMLDLLDHEPLSSLRKAYGQDPFAPVPAFIDTGVALVDAGNVDQYLQAQQAQHTQ
jgi:ribose transport system substrate-binding protein